MILREAIRRPLARVMFATSRCHRGWCRVHPCQSSRMMATTTHVHVPKSRIRSKYKDPSLYDSQTFPSINRVLEAPRQLLQTTTVPSHIKNPDVLVTMYSFPTFEPLEIVHYPATHLMLPLRRDILHRAVIYEGDKTRKIEDRPFITRREHPGSGRKLAPQKGQGRARVGDSSSPVRKGGVKVFGPRARSFATGLPRKMYDLAWRTALSWRYRKGELLVVDELLTEDAMTMDKVQISKLVEAFNGTSLGTAANPRKDEITKEKPLRTMWVLQTGGGNKESFSASLQEWYPKDVVKNVEDVDVKNLLEGKRVVIEKHALDKLLRSRQYDLRKSVDATRSREIAEADAAAMAKAVEETNAIKAEIQRKMEEEAKQLQEDLSRVIQTESIPEIDQQKDA